MTTATKHRPEWVPITAFSELFGVSTRTAYQWARDGKLPSIRFGRTIRVDISALNGFKD